MTTISQIIDTVLPLTKEDRACGMKKAAKLRARAELVIMINDYRNGEKIQLPEQVLKLINA